VLAGPYEFLPIDQVAKASADTAKALALAFARLPYDLVYALPAESRWLEDNGATLPPSFTVAGEQPVAQVRQAGAARVGLLLFPVLAPDREKASPDMVRTVADAALALRQQSDIVVGISPWGASAEQDFLESAGHTVDVLLGSGPGPGFPAKPMAGDAVLWLRPYPQGKTMVELAIRALPRRSPDWKWVRDQNASILLQSLTESITSNPDMEALLDGFHLEQPGR